jgi:hypothetical protein
MNLSTALDRALDRGDRLESKFSKMSARAEAAGRRGLLTTVATIGAMTPGVLRGALGDINTGEMKIPGIDTDADMTLAGVAGVVGLFGIFGIGDKMAEYIAVYGGAVGGAALGRELEDVLRAKRRAA